MTSPRGIRNNNPGNLRDNGIPWRGLTGRDDAGFCIFDTADNGLRAIAMDLTNDYLKKGRRTIEALISEYAPPSENNTRQYIAHAARTLGVQSTDTLTLTLSTLVTVMDAIVTMENGREPYGAARLEAAARSALAYRKLATV